MELHHGQVIYTHVYSNADGTPQRWRINGKTKVWKTRPDDFEVPLKYGMYDHGYLSQNNASVYHLTEEQAIERRDGA